MSYWNERYKSDPRYRARKKQIANRWYKNNRERALSNVAKYRSKYPERVYLAVRNSILKMKYRIDLEQYMVLYREQNGKCAICGRESDRALDVDHDHKTGKMRGLLCRSCNKGLGEFQEKPELLLIAAEYLTKKR